MSYILLIYKLKYKDSIINKLRDSDWLISTDKWANTNSNTNATESNTTYALTWPINTFLQKRPLIFIYRVKTSIQTNVRRSFITTKPQLWNKQPT